MILFLKESTKANHGFNSSLDVVREVKAIFNRTISSGYVRKIRRGFSEYSSKIVKWIILV